MAKTTSTRDTFPIFSVGGAVDPSNPFITDLVGVSCSRCGEVCFVFEGAWRAGEHVSGSTETRPCAYCFKVSRIPVGPTKEEDMDPKVERVQEMMEEQTSEDRGFAEPANGETAPQPTPEPDEGDDPATADPEDDAPSDDAEGGL